MHVSLDVLIPNFPSVVIWKRSSLTFAFPLKTSSANLSYVFLFKVLSLCAQMPRVLHSSLPYTESHTQRVALLYHRVKLEASYLWPAGNNLCRCPPPVAKQKRRYPLDPWGVKFWRSCGNRGLWRRSACGAAAAGASRLVSHLSEAGVGKRREEALRAQRVFCSRWTCFSLMWIRVSRETDPPLERVGLLRGVGQGLGVINQTFMLHVRHLLCFCFFFTGLDLLQQGVFAC